MWLWLSILLTFPVLPSYAAPTGLGQTYEDEAPLLWSEGETALRELRFQEAVHFLQRLIDRYPNSPHSLAAHFALGTAYFKLGRTPEAVPFLKDYISARGACSESVSARLLLGEVYLELKKFYEAQLITQEIEKLPPSFRSLTATQELQLIQIQALLGLQHESRAADVMESLKDLISENTSRTIQGKSLFLELKIKTLNCAHLPSHEAMNEKQIQNQLDRRGTCLLEALLLFQKTLKIQNLNSAQLAARQINQAFKDYQLSCSQPPQAIQIAGDLKKNLHQEKIYRAELVDLMIHGCKDKYKAALELLNSWKAHLPPSTSRLTLEVSNTLEKLSQRN